MTKDETVNFAIWRKPCLVIIQFIRLGHLQPIRSWVSAYEEMVQWSDPWNFDFPPDEPQLARFFLTEALDEARTLRDSISPQPALVKWQPLPTALSGLDGSLRSRKQETLALFARGKSFRALFRGSRSLEIIEIKLGKDHGAAATSLVGADQSSA